MKKYRVEFSGGESRQGINGVNYMLVDVDGIELYAEYDVTDVPEDEVDFAGYDALKESILSQASESEINKQDLIFWLD